jgi:chromosomal replication initiator protein
MSSLKRCHEGNVMRSQCARTELQEVITDDNQIMAEFQALLAARIGRDRYNLWFGPRTKFSLGKQRLLVTAETTFVRDCLRRNFADDVASCCKSVAGHDIRVEFEVAEGEPLPTNGDAAAIPVQAGAVSVVNGHDSPICEGPVDGMAALAALPAAGMAKQTSFLPAEASEQPPAVPCAKPRQKGRAATKAASGGQQACGDPTLSAFMVGKGNEYAFAAAQMTARGLQQASPVLFHGATGVGKTHLLRAIRAEYRERNSRARAIYLTAEQFTTSFVEALRGSGLPSFRQKCRGADLLLIDDLQFFAGKRASLDELLHTLDAMATEGRRLVLGSDRGLAELRALGNELVSRLAGGLACEIQPPDYETRLRIVGRLSQELRIELSEEVSAIVASQITMGARELRGALHRLQAMSVAFERPMTCELAETSLAELVQQCTRPVRLGDVEHAICNVFGVERSELRSERKGRSINEPRMLAMFLARKYTRAPWSEIGQFFGRRSHSTVISAHHRVEQLIRTKATIGVSDQSCGVEEAIRRVETALRTA